MADLVFDNVDNPISPDRAIIHSDEVFSVQWVPRNTGDDVPAFVDRLIVEDVPEGCPGSDDIEHKTVLDVEVEEPELLAGEVGGLAEHAIGPLVTGSYRITVTLANDLGTGQTATICINVVDAV